MEGDGIAVWTGYPGPATAWFYYSRGKIIVKNPDDVLRRKMFDVAATLGARVQGDEGEFYDEMGRVIPDES